MPQQPEALQSEILTTPKILLLDNPQDRDDIGLLVAQGNVVGFQAITYGIGGDITKPGIIQTINHVKGRNPNQLIFPAIPELNMVTTNIDLGRIDPSLQPIVTNPVELGKRISGKTIILVPITDNASINDIRLADYCSESPSGKWMAFLHFGNVHPYAQSFVKSTYDHGVGLFGVVSMNHHGQDTITNLQEAIQFCHNGQIANFITDPTSVITKRSGSYPLIVIARKGVTPPESISEKPMSSAVTVHRKIGNLSPDVVQAMWPEVFEAPSDDLIHRIPAPLFNLFAEREGFNQADIARIMPQLPSLLIQALTSPNS